MARRFRKARQPEFLAVTKDQELPLRLCVSATLPLVLSDEALSDEDQRTDRGIRGGRR